jgi:hypothetical protein
MIRITCRLRKPIARKTPISSLRSRTLPVMVTSTTRLPIRITITETPKENFLNCIRVSMRPFTTCWMAMTLAPGRASLIWRTMSSMGQAVHKAATSTIETRPDLSRTR